MAGRCIATALRSLATAMFERGEKVSRGDIFNTQKKEGGPSAEKGGERSGEMMDGEALVFVGCLVGLIMVLVVAGVSW